jgi:peptidoglycan/xylan/chitin deacetylase (PgdA/CDA1 family)
VRRNEAHASRRQLLIGLLLIPASLLPFVAYAALTPEGRLLRDKAELALSPPELGSVDALRGDVAGAIPMYRDAVMPLVYHGVGSSSSGEGDFAVSPERLGEHLAALRAAGAHFVTPARVAEAFDGGRRLPSRAVLLTFDDGRTDAMMWATPLLEQAHAVATMFVITGAAQEKAVYYADWGALERYDRGPWDLQSHTDALHVEHEVAGGHTLPALTSLAPGESLDEYRARVRADLARADRELTDHTGRRPVAFAYPFGAYGAERTNHPAVRDVLAAEIGRRYRLAFHQDDQETVPLATPDADRLGLRRLSVGDWSGPALVQRVAAAVRRTPMPGDELELVPPVFADAVPAPADDLVPVAPQAPPRRPATPGPSAAPIEVAAPAPVSRNQPAPVLRSQPAATQPDTDREPTSTAAPRRSSSPPTTAAPAPSAPAPSSPAPSAPARSNEPPGNGNGNGRDTAPGQQKKQPR